MRDAARTEVRFGGLSDAAFEQWWAAALTVEDQERAVHIYKTNMIHCRFVCALDALRTNHDDAGDLVVRAYVCAASIPPEHAREHIHRMNAQIVFDHPGVQWLLDQVTYRQERMARERIARRTARRLEKLYDKTEDDEALMDANLQRVILDGSNKYLANASREKIAEDNRKDKAAVIRALAEGRKAEETEHVLPTPQNVTLLMLQLREKLGADEFAKILAEVAPKKLA